MDGQPGGEQFYYWHRQRPGRSRGTHHHPPGRRKPAVFGFRRRASGWDERLGRGGGMNMLKIVVTSDFICPWCWIGHAHLLAALKTAASSQPVQIRFAPFELNPDMPREGLDRKAYRTAKF